MSVGTVGNVQFPNSILNSRRGHKMGVVLVNCGDYFLTTPTDANHHKYNV